MKFGLCTIAFRDADVRGVIRHAAGIGFDEVEIIGKQIDGKSESELDSIRQTAEAAGIAISGVSPYFWLTQDEKLLKTSFEIAERFVAAARRLGARMIRTFTDSGPTGIGSDVATDQQWQTAVESLRMITEMAPELIFAVETHHNTLADTPGTCERLLREVDRPNLKFLYQPFSHGDAVSDFLRLEPEVRQVHLNPHVGSPGGGLADCGIDYAGLLRCLEERGYAESCALELCVPGEADWKLIEDSLDWCRGRAAGAHAGAVT